MAGSIREAFKLALRAQRMNIRHDDDESYPRKIVAVKGMMTIVDGVDNYHPIRESDLKSCRGYVERLHSRKHLDVPHAFRIQAPTLIVMWLVRMMANNLPDALPFELDYIAVIELHLVAKYFGVSKNDFWLQQLFASRVASNPWGCLARAFNYPIVDGELAQKVITALPHQHLLDLNNVIDLAIHQMELPEDVEDAVAQLTFQPCQNWITYRFIGGDVTFGTGPFFALVLASRIARETDPRLACKALDGCPEAVELLTSSIAVEFRMTWGKILRHAGSATWMSNHSWYASK